MGSWAVGIGLGLACAALAGGAQADDWLPPATTPQPLPAFSFLQEVRVGAYAHNWIHNENAPLDLSVEALSSPLTYDEDVRKRFWAECEHLVSAPMTTPETEGRWTL